MSRLGSPLHELLVSWNSLDHSYATLLPPAAPTELLAANTAYPNSSSWTLPAASDTRSSRFVFKVQLPQAPVDMSLLAHRQYLQGDYQLLVPPEGVTEAQAAAAEKAAASQSAAAAGGVAAVAAAKRGIKKQQQGPQVQQQSGAWEPDAASRGLMKLLGTR